MYRGDARDRWRSGLLDDPRVEHWWDEKRIVGRRFLEELRPHGDRRAAGSRVFKGDVLWDAYLLFDRRAEWGASLPRPVKWGYTILAAREALATETATQLELSHQPSRDAFSRTWLHARSGSDDAGTAFSRAPRD